MSDLKELKQRVRQQVEAMREALIHISDAIHAHPEIAFQEYESAALLSKTLEENGFAVERGVAGLETAFVATLHGKEAGSTVAFLAEYDALPEIGHACGHNLIGTSAVGAGLAMKTVLPELAGTIQVIGTPAEEGGGGKILMVNGGVFEGVDAAMMVHPSSYTMTRRRSKTSHDIKVEFYGKPAHASASPDLGINALDALILTFNGINAMRQQLRDEARIHGIITDGGTASNVIPEYAAGRFGIRAAALPYALELIDKLRACAEAGALAAGARLAFTEADHFYDAMLPNPILADLADENLAVLGLEVRAPNPNDRMGSSDMGNVSQVVPALHPYLTICSEDIAGHSAEFREVCRAPAGHQGMIQAAQLLAMTAVDLLAAPENMAKARAAFQKAR